MSFKLSDFTAAPSQELLDLAKKTDLLDIAENYGVPNIKKTMKKHVIMNILIEYFIKEEIFYSSATSKILVTQTDLQLREIEIKKSNYIGKIKIRSRGENKKGERGARRENKKGERGVRRENKIRNHRKRR